MIDFSLKEEQESLRALVRKFVEKEIKPLTEAFDSRVDPKECFPWEIFEKAHKLGLRALTLSEKYGGAGADILTTAILVEELCAGDVGIGVTMEQMWMAVQVMQTMASQEQCDRFLPLFRDNPRFLFVVAACEPEAGSNVFLHCLDPRAGFRLSAILQDFGPNDICLLNLGKTLETGLKPAKY